jgi:hypothetical protein
MRRMWRRENLKSYKKDETGVTCILQARDEKYKCKQNKLRGL